MKNITHLMPLAEFSDTLKKVNDADYRRILNNYKNFIRQPLELGMFIPCDDEGNYLSNSLSVSVGVYSNAKNKVLFKGLHIEQGVDGFYIYPNEDAILEIAYVSYKRGLIVKYNYIKNIEHLVKWELKLNQSAIKKIYETN